MHGDVVHRLGRRDVDAGQRLPSHSVVAGSIQGQRKADGSAKQARYPLR